MLFNRNRTNKIQRITRRKDVDFIDSCKKCFDLYKKIPQFSKKL